MKPASRYKMNIWVGAMVALIYVLIPVDIAPDTIPIFGWIDDAIAVLLAVANGIHFASKIKKGKKI